MIRAFTDADADAVWAIQVMSPPSAQWREADYVESARDAAYTILVAEVDGAVGHVVAGFAVFHRGADEGELRNLAVEPTERRKGIARALLAEGIRIMQGCGVRQMFLEVRASNQAAKALYASMGFTLIHIRPHYYSDPVEDAHMMAADLSALANGGAPREA
jgi:ribosomal-protein-alanine N-acetyltransferase